MDHNFSESLNTTKTAVISSKGIVASQHKLASRAGAKVLAEGGNAVDAALATAFTVSVLEPWMSGIGGGGHMLIYNAPSGKVHAIDYGMRSPRELNPEDYPLSGEGLASDLTHFLMWAAEPKMEIRKRIGVAAVFFLSIFVIMSYFAKRRVWADLH